METEPTLYAAPARKRKEAVSLENVSFSYDGERHALNGLSFQANAGEFIWVKGSSGVGKSTIFKALLRLYPIDSGKIRLFGEDVAELSPGALREAVAYVPQEPFLFKGSILKNIALARPGATPAEVEAAAKKVNLDGFIASLPEGYQTDIGEGGALLSGGQRQRMAIAQAFLKDALVWLLDEPLSALDALNAAAFYDAFAADLDGKTVLMVSHREDVWELRQRMGERLRVIELEPPSSALG